MTHRRIHPRRGFLAALLILALAGLGLGSCSQRLGWGLVLWSAPEGPIAAGAVVPVYIRSNINKVFVVGTPDGSKKLELPFWQVELQGSKAKARRAASAFAPYAGLYLVATRDGLPVRETPANTAPRVYRLREGQSVKILEKVKGEEVRTGDMVLQGDWYFVLADDGTRGYAFSNTLRVYDETKEGFGGTLLAKTKAPSLKIDALFSRSWRPEYFQVMMDEGRLDLDIFSPRLGIFADAVHRQIRIELPSVSQVFQYNSIAEDSGAFIFEGSPLRVRFEPDGRLLADWSGISKAAPAGSPAPKAATPSSGTAAESQDLSAVTASAYFVVLDTDLRDAIRTEELRRQRLLETFLVHGSEWVLVPEAGSSLNAEAGTPLALAPVASLDSILANPVPAAPAVAPAVAPAGAEAPLAAPTGAPAPGPAPADPGPAKKAPLRLSIANPGRFTLVNHAEAPAGYLPPGLSPTGPAQGELAFRLFLGKNVQASWQGILSLRFDKVAGYSWVDFLYRFDGPDLILEPAAPPSGLVVDAASPLLPLRLSPARPRQE